MGDWLQALLHAQSSELPVIATGSFLNEWCSALLMLATLVVVLIVCIMLPLLPIRNTYLRIAVTSVVAVTCIIYTLSEHRTMIYGLTFHTDWCYVKPSEDAEWQKLPEVTHKAMSEYVSEVFEKHAEVSDKACTLLVYFEDTCGQITKPVALTIIRVGSDYVAVEGSETTEILTLACELSEAVPQQMTIE